MKRYHVDGGIPTLEAALSEFMLCLLLEYAATLGLIDVALIPPAGARRDYGGLWGTDELVYFSRYDGLMYFRVTPLGAYCLGSHGRGPAGEKPPRDVADDQALDAGRERGARHTLHHLVGREIPPMASMAMTGIGRRSPAARKAGNPPLLLGSPRPSPHAVGRVTA